MRAEHCQYVICRCCSCANNTINRAASLNRLTDAGVFAMSFIIYKLGGHQRVISKRMGGLYWDNQHAEGFLTSSEKRRRRERRRRKGRRREERTWVKEFESRAKEKGGGRRTSRGRLSECEVSWRDFGRLIVGNIALEILPRHLETNFEQLKKWPETLVHLFPPSLALSLPRLRIFPTAGHHLQRLRGITTNRNFPAKEEPKRPRSGFVGLRLELAVVLDSHSDEHPPKSRHKLERAAAEMCWWSRAALWPLIFPRSAPTASYRPQERCLDASVSPSSSSSAGCRQPPALWQVNVDRSWPCFPSQPKLPLS